jgi:Ca2+-binding EF-hand superfamily protein
MKKVEEAKNVKDEKKEKEKKKGPEHKMNFPEFVLFLFSNMHDNFTIKQNLKQSFSRLDRNDDGFITKEELKNAFQEVEEEISDEEVEFATLF